MQRGIVAGLCVLVVCIAVFFVNQKDPENVKPKRWTFEHLPNSVEPTHYSIQIQPSFEDFTFRGTEVVNINILHDDQTSITLHAHQLKIIEADLEFGSTTIPAIEISYNSTFKQATLHFMQLLPQISAKLKIHFEGSMTNKLAGLYRSEYKNPISQSPSFIISTHMQPNDARQVFPCWDEPAIKSTFSITLLVPSNLTAIANMPIIKTTQISTNLKEVVFDKTPVMSAYLVAFAVGDLGFVEGKTKQGVTIRVYSVAGKEKQGEFGLQVAVDTLSFFSEYFKIDYPLPKLDLLATPDFAAGAMENWGLSIFREIYLLCNPNDSGITTLQNIAYVVAHELAHQWFGNLVTVAWWKELWLNEGFATWAGNLAVDHLFPEWNMWSQFQTLYFTSAQNLDALKSSHPVEVEVPSGDQAFQIFDTISYCKGASIIRMLDSYLSPANFRHGLHLYLTRHSYANAITEDLWQALGEYSGRNVSAFMHHWTASVGYPVVKISSKPNGKILLEQSRFLLTDGNPDSTIWNISVTFRTPEKLYSVQFDKKAEQFSVPQDILDAEWIYANADQAGFYRVSYPEAWTKKILSNVNKLSAVERMGLQNDWFALGFANMIDIHHAVSLAQSYKSETSYAVWSDLHENLRTLADLWVDQPTYPVLESMFEEIFSSVLDRLGFTHKDDDTDVQKLLRVLIIDQAGYYKNPQVLNWAKEAFASHISGVSSIAPDFRKTVYKLVCLNQGEEAFKQLKTLFFQAETTEEQNRLLVGLGYSRNESLIREVLELSLSPSVRVQDGFFVFISTSLSQVGRQTAWEYFKEHWEEYVERYATNSFIFVKMIELVTKSFHSYEAAADVEEFFSTRATPAINLKISQSLEQIRSKASWYSAQSSKFAEYLENQN